MTQRIGPPTCHYRVSGLVQWCLCCVGGHYWKNGGYAWWRAGKWDSITVGGTLSALARMGIDTRAFDGPAWYPQSDVGWTLLIVPAALIGVWLSLSKRPK